MNKKIKHTSRRWRKKHHFFTVSSNNPHHSIPHLLASAWKQNQNVLKNYVFYSSSMLLSLFQNQQFKTQNEREKLKVTWNLVFYFFPFILISFLLDVPCVFILSWLAAYFFSFSTRINSLIRAPHFRFMLTSHNF